MKPSADSKGHSDVSPVIQRILGAVVLVAIALVVVPVLFDFSSRRSPGIDEGLIPPRPDDLRVEVLPLRPPKPPVVPREEIDARIDALVPGKDEGRQSVSSPPSPAVSPPPEGRRPMAETPKPPARAAAGRPAKVAGPAAVGSGWVVQVGSFGRRDNARRFLSRIEKAGFQGVLQVTKGRSGKTVTRVLVGPVATKREARVLRRRLKQGPLAIDGLVRHYEAKRG